MDLNKDFGIYYHGVPIKPIYKGRKTNWITMFEAFKYLHKDYLEIDGWRFNLSYGLLYLKERNEWRNYYIPINGLKCKFILDIGGGCGETAKFFLESGALGVDIIEANKECRKYLKYNSEHHNIRAYIKKFDIKDIYDDNYDLIKMDIEGYEIELLPYLDKINIDIVLETHSQYITDKFIEKGFNYCQPINNIGIEIYGGVYQLCRWKK